MSAIIIAIYMWLGIQFGVDATQIRLIEDYRTEFQNQAPTSEDIIEWEVSG